MLKDWLEPAVKHRIETLTDDFCDDEDARLTYVKFTQAVGKLSQSQDKADQQLVLLELEDLFNTSFRLGVGLSYRVGFEDGLDIGNSLRKRKLPSLIR